MKRNQVTLAALIAALSFFAASSVGAISQSDILTIKRAVAAVPAAEVSAKAVQMVTQASETDREEVALTTIREVVVARPAAVVAVVAAISKAAPEVSVAVAAEAAKLSSGQATEIARAAATGAPAKSDQIAAAVAKVTPKAALKVTRAVASVVPDQTARVIETVVASVPAAKPQIAADAGLQRMSQRSAAGPAPTGIIITRGGTIRGTTPSGTPTDAGDPVEGADSQRLYGTP
jgi:hypothetical protein